MFCSTLVLADEKSPHFQATPNQTKSFVLRQYVRSKQLWVANKSETRELELKILFKMTTRAVKRDEIVYECQLDKVFLKISSQKETQDLEELNLKLIPKDFEGQRPFKIVLSKQGVVKVRGLGRAQLGKKLTGKVKNHDFFNKVKMIEDVAFDDRRLSKVLTTATLNPKFSKKKHQERAFAPRFELPLLDKFRDPEDDAISQFPFNFSQQPKFSGLTYVNRDLRQYQFSSQNRLDLLDGIDIESIEYNYILTTSVSEVWHYLGSEMVIDILRSESTSVDPQYRIEYSLRTY